MSHVLVIAKDAVIRNTLATRLSHELVTEAVTAPAEAKRRLHVQYFDLVSYDAESLPAERARTFKLLAKLAHKRPDIRVIKPKSMKYPYAGPRVWC